MNEKDKHTAQRIMNSANIPVSAMSAQEFADLCRTIESALAAVRKETRAAALRGAANTIYAMSRIEKRHESVAFMNGAVWMQNKAAKLIESTIEAAANTEEGGGDAKRG